MEAATKRTTHDSVFLEQTRSICPVCRQVLEAEVVSRAGKVFLRKRCPEHGRFEAVVYGDAERYVEIQRYNKPGEAAAAVADRGRGGLRGAPLGRGHGSVGPFPPSDGSLPVITSRPLLLVRSPAAPCSLPGVGSITDAWLTSLQASTSRALEADGALPRAVDDEAGHVGPRVMADDIEVLPLLAHEPMVERNDVHLLFRGRRLEEPVAVRSSHRGPACREPFGRPREELVPKGDSGRHVGCTEHAGHGDDERPALEGDHPGDVSCVARAPRPRGDV